MENNYDSEIVIYERMEIISSSHSVYNQTPVKYRYIRNNHVLYTSLWTNVHTDIYRI